MKSTPTNEPEVIDLRGRGQAGPADLAQLELLARWMDSVFEIPGLRLRFGLDALIGLLPGLGDLVSSVVTLFILQEAHRRGVSRLTLARMGGNIVIDWLIGSLPLVGDVFDVYWKANQRNVELLLRDVDPAQAGRRKRTGDWLFLLALIAVLLAALVGSITITYWIVASLFRWLFPS